MSSHEDLKKAIDIFANVVFRFYEELEESFNYEYDAATA